MDLVSVGAALRRRWAVLVVGLAVALAGGAYTYTSAADSYTSASAVVLVPPAVSDGSTGSVGDNQYLRLDYAVATTASILVRTVDSGPVRAKIGALQDGDFEITNIALEPQTFTPTIDITTTGTSEAQALATGQAVVDTLADELSALQQRSGVPVADRISLEVAVAPTDAVVSASGRLRAGGAVFVGLALVVVLGALALDGALRARRGRAATTGGVTTDDRPATPARTPARPSATRTTGDEPTTGRTGRATTAGPDATSARPRATTPSGGARSGQRRSSSDT